MDEYLSLSDAVDCIEPGDSPSLCLHCGCDPCQSPEFCAALEVLNHPFVPDEFTTHAEQCNIFHDGCASSEECEEFDYTRLVQCWRCRLWVKIEDADEFLSPGHAGSLAPPPCGTYGQLCNSYDPTFGSICQEPIDHIGLHVWVCYALRMLPGGQEEWCMYLYQHLGKHQWDSL